MSFLFSTRRLLSDPRYKTVPWSSVIKEHEITKHNAGEFDHLIIDCGPAAGACLRFTKDLYGPERDFETSNAIFRQHINHLAKVFKPRKSIFVALDGSDPLWKVRKNRMFQQKKHWNRFLRSGATPLGFATEERAKFLATTEHAGSWLQELVVSGPSSPGPVECKISQWMLDLAARANDNKEAYEQFCASTPLPKMNAGASSSSSSSTTNPAAFAGQQNLSASAQRRQQQFSTHAAMFPGVTRGDSIAFVGQADNFPSVLAMTPFINTAIVTADGKLGYKMQYSRQLMDWHGFETLWDEATPSNKAVARARTDVVLMRILTAGLSATNLNALPGGIKIEDLLDAYHTFLRPAGKTLTKDHPTSGVLIIDSAALETLLTRAANVKASTVWLSDKIAEDYLEILCQSMSALCDGGIKNYGFVPQTNFDCPPPNVPGQPAAQHQGLNLQQLVFHLRGLAGRPLTASVDRNFALTPAEMLMTSALEPQWISEILPAYTNGNPLPPGVAESICGTKNVREAYKKVQGILSLVIDKNRQKQQQQQQQTGTTNKKDALHRALYHCPAHVWTRKLGTRGPPDGFVYRPVNLGEAAVAKKTRLGVMTDDGFGIGAEGMFGKKIAHPLVYLDEGSNMWVEAQEEGLPKHLIIGGTSDQEQPITTLLNRADSPGKLTVVNWNVQFNRYSGKDTPLGKPGIDWCSATRHVCLEKVLSTVDADIISMQEVEAPWWEALARSAWVRERYVFSTSAKGRAINPWGSLVLINRRLPVLRQGLLNMSAGGGHVSWMPTVTIQMTPTKTLTFGTCHLLAPFMEKNIQNRESQVNTLIGHMAPKHTGNDVVIAGDFNDYPTNFFVMPPRMQFRDSWQEVHGDQDGDAGWTINGRKNTYTALLIEEEFYGRADRILVKSRHLKAREASLIGTESARSLMGVDTIKDYLFPSDHFGVKVVFDVSAEEQPQQQ